MHKIQRTLAVLIIGTMAITGVATVELTGAAASIAGPKPCC